jgi:4-carboxymuconolactone decarboxylase
VSPTSGDPCRRRRVEIELRALRTYSGGPKGRYSEEAVCTLTTGGLPDELSDQEKIAQRFARQLSAEHHVDAALYSAAEKAFGQRGLVEMAYLIGIYHTVCALLNAFEIPTPR